MIELVRTDSTHPDFVTLVRLLDADLAQRDGDEHAFYHQFNQIDHIKHVVVAYENDKPIGCGAMKEYTLDAMEIKRMYALPAFRGQGIASRTLAELETWAAELGYQRCVLETGKKQPEAIALYKKFHYAQTENYGPYIGIENSVCFEKKLN